jgi:hypothetical protein
MRYLIVLSAITFFASGAYAETKKSAAASHESSGGAVHRSDGCGVGWQYTKKKTLFGTTTRGTTNNNLSTFGMSSGTLGCQKHPIASREQDAVNYALSNYENLSIELAQGRGEFVDGMAQAMGCDAQSFGQVMQSHYGSIMAGSGAELYGNMKAFQQQDPSLISACNI